MKLRTLSALFAVMAMTPLYAIAQEAAPAPAPAAAPAPAMPQGTDAWAQTMWDFTRNPIILKDPKAFVPFATAATEPGFYTSLGYQMLDPAMWGLMANSMMHPSAYGAWAPLMTDPNIYMKWLAAGMDPNFYTALLTQFTDPGKAMRWAMLPVDPKVWGLMMQSINPAVYLKWMMAPLDPRWIQAMVTPINPNVYMAWLGSMVNPASYGDLWKNFLTTPYVPAGVPAITVPSATGTTPYIFNPFDPNAWNQFWQTVPQVAPPAPPK